MTFHNPETNALVRTALTYDPETGIIRRAKSAGNKSAGAVAGWTQHIRRHSYRNVRAGRRIYKAHRVAWFLFYGVWPEGEIDHINGDGLDNRIANLRVATRSQNQANAKKKRISQMPYKGICYSKKNRKWIARIRTTYIGSFPTAEAAHAAYMAAAHASYGEFARAA